MVNRDMSVLCKNCRDFVKYKPPLFIFSLCILCLFMSTILVGLHVVRSNQIVDSDAKYDWIRLADYLSADDLCLQSPETNYAADSDKISTFTTYITVDGNALNRNSIIQTVYDIKDFRPTCAAKSEVQNHIMVSFNTDEVVNLSMVQVCAQVTGIEQYLPRFSNPACDPKLKSDLKTVVYSNGGTNCQSKKIRFHFDGTINMDNFAVFLSESDKELILRHLLIFVVILGSCLLIIIAHVMCTSHYHEDVDRTTYF